MIVAYLAACAADVGGHGDEKAVHAETADGSDLYLWRDHRSSVRGHTSCWYYAKTNHEKPRIDTTTATGLTRFVLPDRYVYDGLRGRSLRNRSALVSAFFGASAWCGAELGFGIVGFKDVRAALHALGTGGAHTVWQRAGRVVEILLEAVGVGFLAHDLVTLEGCIGSLADFDESHRNFYDVSTADITNTLLAARRPGRVTHDVDVVNAAGSQVFVGEGLYLESIGRRQLGLSESEPCGGSCRDAALTFLETLPSEACGQVCDSRSQCGNGRRCVPVHDGAELTICK